MKRFFKQIDSKILQKIRQKVLRFGCTRHGSALIKLMVLLLQLLLRDVSFERFNTADGW